MKLQLDNLADKACWISHDRVNACISCSEQGIAEIGYHGTQPVSKNSRIFVGGAVSVALRMGDGSVHPVAFNDIDWTPSQVAAEGRYCNIQIVPFQRSIRCTIRPVEEAEVVLTFNLESLNLSAHGTRVWSDPEIQDDSVILSCRDRIVLNEWLNRTGPYAGDFLIPEPMRRIIFDKPVRSGQAKLEDVHPEFREAPIPIYDASVFARIGGRGVRLGQQSNALTFSADAGPDRAAEFFILFGDQRSDVVGPPRAIPTPITEPRQVSITVPGHPAVERFVQNVPDLVDSAIVRDHGMPRATPAAYYWIWAWDSLVTGMEMLRWGDVATTRRMAAFVNTHRDRGGLIPMRWTRSLAPLDTPPRGSLEFLFATFVYQHVLEAGDPGPLTDAYPYLVNHLEVLGRISDDEGMFACSGFYPDFTAKFGRKASSVVAMEVAAHYVFARTLENIAQLLSDATTEWRAKETANRIEAHFLERFWDDERGFLHDAFDQETGDVNESYPLFTMLFLQSSLGIPLVRSRIDALATFCTDELMGTFGTSLLPAWDKNRANEDATASWYPHWDAYLLKILRRGGRSAEIMQWLGNVERVLEHLGYCPEFIKLDQDPEDPASWLQHGAVSNLNCVTGWFRAVLEGLFGLEVDPGGLNIIPLSLPLETLTFDGVVYRGTRWSVAVRNDGDHLEALVIDGTRWEGICKIPARYYDGTEHSLEILYGSVESGLQFREIINGELIDIDRSDDSLTVTIRPLGTCEVVFYASTRPDLQINGQSTAFKFDEPSGIGTLRIVAGGDVRLTLVS